MDANHDMVQVTSNAHAHDSALANGRDTEDQTIEVTKEMAYGTNANERAVDCSNFACAYPKSRAPKVRPPPPFVQKVYDMVQNPEFDCTISWGSSGRSFIIWDAHKFAAEVLTMYFKHNNFTSFICQLNTYCFKKINWERLEFQNEWFQKGKKRWLKYIKRRNQITSKHVQESPGAASEMKKEVEHLRQQQTDLKVEIGKLKENQEKQVEEMDILHKRRQRAVSKRRKIVQLISQKLRLEGGEKGIESNTKNTLMLQQLEEDLLNGGEEDVGRFDPSLVIGMEELMAGPAGWMEYSKQLTTTLKPHCKIEKL